MTNLRESAIRLVSKRVLLREVELADVPRLRELLRTREVTRHTYLRYPFRLEDARAYVTTARKWKRRGYGFRLAIVERTTGKVVGGIALFQIDSVNGHGEIGYWLGKPYWGTGLIDHAVRLVLQYAFGKLRLRRIYGHVWTTNAASCRTVERLGFTLEGTLRQSVRWQGWYLDQRVYAILREEYRNSQPRCSRG